MDTRELHFDGFLFSTDKGKLDLEYIHDFLARNSYWAPEIPMSVVEKSVENSLCIGVYEGALQVGFARIVTDYSTFGYLADVFIEEGYRGRGLSKALMGFVFSFEFVSGLRRFMLGTRDAHGLYQQFGFRSFENPDRFMEINQPGIYSNN
jgi:GNAT superfamily N-acetyltransferase